MNTADNFPADYNSGNNEAQKSYHVRRSNGFFSAYLAGAVVLDVGYRGVSGPQAGPVVPSAIGIDLDYPGYDGVTLPFEDDSVDTVFSSHCLEHIVKAEDAIRDWHRVLKCGGYIVCIVPHQHLYEKRLHLPSRYNPDHKVFFTPSTLLALFERALAPNSYRVRHCNDNDMGFDYTIGPDRHSVGCYEIELVVEKLIRTSWTLEDS